MAEPVTEAGRRLWSDSDFTVIDGLAAILAIDDSEHDLAVWQDFTAALAPSRPAEERKP